MTYTTQALIEGYLRTTFDGTTTPTSATIAGWITWAESEIDQRIQGTFGTSAVADEVYDFNEYTTKKSTETETFWDDQTARIDQSVYNLGNDVLELKQKPVVSVSKVERNLNSVTSSASWETLTEGVGGDYLVDTTNARITFIQNPPRYGKQSVRVNYVYGYSSVPSTVERLATLLVAREVVRSAANRSANQEGGSVQVGPIRVTDPSSFSIDFVRSINDEIGRAWMSVGVFKTQLI